MINLREEFRKESGCVCEGAITFRVSAYELVGHCECGKTMKAVHWSYPRFKAIRRTIEEQGEKEWDHYRVLTIGKKKEEKKEHKSWFKKLIGGNK